MAYHHGIRVVENPTSLIAPILGTAALQVIFGTAPINLAQDPYKVTNVPTLIYSYQEAVSAMGYSEDFEHYTLCQSMDMCFRNFNIAPIILVNVLDPKKHKTDVQETEYLVIHNQVTVNVSGMLLDKMVVKKDATVLQKDMDYLSSFNSDGHIVITLLDTGAGVGAKKVVVSGVKIDPTLVTTEDIIGGYDFATGDECGLETIRQIYIDFGMTPGLILAPGWSQDPNVAAAMTAKCEEINGCFRCECIIDIDCSEQGATVYTKVKEAKERQGVQSIHAAAVWPKVMVGKKIYYMSAMLGAATAYTDATNDDVPNLSPSNKAGNITGLCLENGKTVKMDLTHASVVNSYGVITAVNANGWKTWGNNTAAYPSSTDPKDRWFCCRRFFSWWANSFILTYFQKVDEPSNLRLIEAICDAENIRGNSYVAQGKCAGCRIEFSMNENPTTNLLDGKLQFHQYLAPYPPAEDILNVLEFDPDMLREALGGG